MTELSVKVLYETLQGISSPLDENDKFRSRLYPEQIAMLKVKKKLGDNFKGVISVGNPWTFFNSKGHILYHEYSVIVEEE